MEKSPQVAEGLRFIPIERDNFLYTEDSDRFALAVEVLKPLMMAHWANEMLSDVDSINKSINTKIFSDIVHSIITEKPFSDEQLIEYFTELKTYVHVFDSLRKFTSFEPWIDHKIEFILFGLDYDSYTNLPKEQKEALHTHIDDPFWKMWNNEYDLEEFIEKVKELIELARQRKLTLEKTNI